MTQLGVLLAAVGVGGWGWGVGRGTSGGKGASFSDPGGDSAPKMKAGGGGGVNSGGRSGR